FSTCQKHQTREEFQKLGFPGTPILIIGDTQVNGTPSPEELKKLIEKELNQ
ncbi:DsbA family protein, partial [Parageobacillus thermoglucosidasius]